MRSQELVLNLQPSKIPLLVIILIFMLAILVMHYVPPLKISMWLFIATVAIYWLYKYLTYPYYQIQINTRSRAIQITSTQAHMVNLLQVKSIAWWLTIVKFVVINNQRTITIPVFMDSLTLKQYKSFRMFTLWQ